MVNFYMKNMKTKKCLLIISTVFELCSAKLLSCSKPHDEKSICFTNNTSYSVPFPLSLDVGIFLKDIIEIDQDKNSLSIRLDLWTNWIDPGLGVTNDEGTENGLQLDKKTAELVWQPGFKFENLLDYKQTKGYGVTPTSSFWIFENHSHYLQYGEEFQLTISCHFNFKNFPFDLNECPIYFGNDLYSTDELIFDRITIYYADDITSQGKDSIFIDDMALPFEFELEALAVKQKSFNFNVSSVGILIRMRRHSLGQLLSGYYYPTASFALLSMVSFLIDPDVVPGRMGMIVTLYLISANVYNSVDAPKNRGFSCIEIWMLGTQFPILLALLEYGFVLYMKKVTKVSDENDTNNYEEKIKKLDLVTMLVSFGCFIMFTFVYYIVALNLD